MTTHLPNAWKNFLPTFYPAKLFTLFIAFLICICSGTSLSAKPAKMVKNRPARGLIGHYINEGGISGKKPGFRLRINDKRVIIVKKHLKMALSPAIK